MGCGASSQSRYEAKSEDPPVTRRDQQGLLEPTLTRGTSGDDSSINSDQAGMKAPITLAQGNHWAENSPMKERRVAERPWVKPAPEAAPQEAVGVCSPCDNAFEFTCTFPMMVMKMETFMRLKIMQSYEELLKSGDIFEWAPDMGRVFFLSHQWTSFSHPDPLAEQLQTAQGFLEKIGKGQIRSLFATEEEWLAFHYKEANRFLQFDPVTEEQMAADVLGGYVWLDYASVPQSTDGEEARLRAIDSIPFYVDHALCFLAIVPTVEHKDLPGTFCTYKSWTERGWCRLETQVHEMRLFIETGGELMPGVPKLDLPRRPLIVHSANYATTYDMMDNFYMLWQRKNSVFTGEFACCRLGHKRKGTKGELMSVICDKDRIRPLVRALWDRKIAHLAACGPFVVFLFHWRWASHADMMMADVSDDVEECNDQLTRTLDDMICKYALDETHRTTFHSMFPMFSAMFTAHPSMDEPEGTPCTGGAGSAMKAQLIEWFDKWDAVAADSRKYQVAWATCFAVAEGNLRMLQLLHEEHGADLTLGFCWGITLLDFASGKGHTRIIDYLIRHGVTETIDKPSFRDRITAIDRASKAGFDDVLNLLVERGAQLKTVRINRQTPAHGAAMMGHVHILQRLHELGADLVHSYDESGKSPLDYAVYFCHKASAEYLRDLQGGALTQWETQRVVSAATKMQALRRGSVARVKVALRKASP